jgi:integrase/recombinase XerD
MTRLIKAVQKYLTMRYQLGYKLKRATSVLKGFSAYAKQKKVSHITTKIALEYATQNLNAAPPSWASRLGIIRRFALHMRLLDPLTEVPPPDLLPYSYRRRSPYIYSENDILKILKACNILSNPLDAKTYYTLLGLIAVTGLRPGEALNLERDSVDMSLGIITIRDSKFRKTRKVPVHKSTIKKLQEYVKYRDQYFRKKMSPYFFVDKRGYGLRAGTVRSIFGKICIQAGLRNKEKHVRTRIMDFRHTFAIKTLVRCYLDGLNADIVMPILSMYLGHENPIHTYWYLSATPELFGLINARLEKKFGGKQYESY